MYLDSCILVKLFVPEPDSDFFSESLSGVPLTTCELAHTEVLSALLAGERGGKLTSTSRKLAWREFEARISAGEIRVESLTKVTLSKARQILDRCLPRFPLRTLDAIHLAAADLCQDFPLATTDGRMRDAALHLGFEVFPPAEAVPAK